MEDESPEKTEKKETSSRARPMITRGERIFLFIANVAIITILISDVLYFVGMVQEIELPSLAFGNLGVLVLAYFSYLLKRRIRRRILRAKRNVEGDQALQEKKDK